ncbi:MAG: tyrosine-type recombinase/integrase [Verrucomicrobia bacterium]|nr:tyrosine-type recombinase/integrase [Verrucomicrobiota bacterium]
MASLYKRPNSPFIWIKYKDAAGVQQAHTTGFRYAVPSQVKKANVLLNEKRLIELKTDKGITGDRWDSWVMNFLDATYATKPKTLERYKISWKNLSPYLAEQKVSRPMQLTFRHCELYVPWRLAGQPQVGIYKCGHNTALGDLKVLHLICNYAIKRGFIGQNPASSLGIKKHKPREKPELTDEDIALIRDQLQELKMPEWMETSFEIAIHQGCRLAETAIPFSRIDFKKKTILFKAKGDRDFTAPLHPKLIPRLQKLKKKGLTITCVLPPLPSKQWWRFFKKIGLYQKGVCFHCTRVTVITRLIRAGKPENVVKKIVNHSSTEVHRIYQRLSVDDVRGALDDLKV